MFQTCLPIVKHCYDHKCGLVIYTCLTLSVLGIFFINVRSHSPMYTTEGGHAFATCGKEKSWYYDQNEVVGKRRDNVHVDDHAYFEDHV